MPIPCHMQPSTNKHVLHISSNVVSCFDLCKQFAVKILPALLVFACSHVPKDGTLPPVVTPGESPGSIVPPPDDAEVLFDGASLDRWQKSNGKPAAWNVKRGYLQVKRFSGDIQTRNAYGDIQLHLEFATPAHTIFRGQHRGNSGIKFMGLYEVQILDSFKNDTYPDGQAGAVYSQHPPLVNASRPPGQWQTLDIIFLRPRFSEDGELIEPAYTTVFHNGVIIQNHVALRGPTRGDKPYSAHPDRLPLVLQDHRSKVRFRNIWVRSIE